ncbi:MAG: helix-turn-helix domain-containing protein [Oscillospiraceae bacterium]|nr:helix-turn-helix domain-containing protein [Oscillospiraceae bacterium]
MKNNIKAARENSGKTQKECSEAFNISLRAWQGYEQGIREPKFELLCKIADLFNVTTDYLLGREPKEEIDPIELLPVDDWKKALLRLYIAMDSESRPEMVEIIKKIADGADVQLTVNKPEIQQTTKQKQKEDDEYITYTTTIGAEMDRRKAIEAVQRAGELDDAETKKSAG